MGTAHHRLYRNLPCCAEAVNIAEAVRDDSDVTSDAQTWLDVKEEMEGEEGVKKMKLFKARTYIWAISTCALVCLSVCVQY